MSETTIGTGGWQSQSPRDFLFPQREKMQKVYHRNCGETQKGAGDYQ